MSVQITIPFDFDGYAAIHSSARFLTFHIFTCWSTSLDVPDFSKVHNKMPRQNVNIKVEIIQICETSDRFNICLSNMNFANSSWKKTWGALFFCLRRWGSVLEWGEKNWMKYLGILIHGQSCGIWKEGGGFFQDWGRSHRLEMTTFLLKGRHCVSQWVLGHLSHEVG